MARPREEDEIGEIAPLPIFSYYNKQRFEQVGSMDCANWYGLAVPDTKSGQALYPAMGRKHIEYFGENKLVFDSEPRVFFKSIDYLYVVVGTSVLQFDKHFQQKNLGNVGLGGQIWYDSFAVGTKVYVGITDSANMYVVVEDGLTSTMNVVTDPNRPDNPTYIAAFGNRFAVSDANTPDYFLTGINLTDVNGAFNLNGCFTINGTALFNQASGIVRQFAVLHNQLYIFTDYTTDILANIPSQVTVNGVTQEFPWKVNTSYNWDYGINDPLSLDVGFGRMIWAAQNKDGLISFMMSTGQQPQDISSQAINVLLQNSQHDEGLSPFAKYPINGFIYQYENSIFYRASAGIYQDFGQNDLDDSSQSIEYNFGTQKWERRIELNGERNRIQKHVYFNNKHIVSVQGDNALYEMAGNIYRNELRTPDTAAQDINAFTKYPFRYELVTQQIYQPDYSEFMTRYIEIDFVFGNRTFYESNAPFDNTVFIITEDSADPCCPIFVIAEDQEDSQPVFLITEDGNFPTFDDNHYNALFKPFIGLYYSDDGGVTFTYADQLKFSNLGDFRWRMRWYNLGASRNRCYMLICVSSAPIVVLGGVQNIYRSSGGAN